MSNKRWNTDDKIQLMNLFSKGKSYEEIGTFLKRSPNAIKLRLESIVYDNLVKGKTLEILTKMLNIDEDTIKQLYYSHKSFRQARGEAIEDVDFSNNINNVQKQSYIIPQLNRQNNKNNLATIKNLERIEKENIVMDSILKNYQMKKQLKKLYIDGKLDKKGISMYESLIKNYK